MIKRIIIAGKGGQGIKLLGHVLAGVLSELKMQVSLILNYDADVRGGDSIIFLTYSEKKIENPTFEEADIFINLSGNFKTIKSKKTLVEKDFCKENCNLCDLRCKNAIALPFQKTSMEKFGSVRYINMIALGKILNLIGIKIDEKTLKKELPLEYLEKNLQAIRFGFTYRED